MIRSKWFRSLIPEAIFLTMVLSSGCMWGVVRDAKTGVPISGAYVHISDSQYNIRFTTTDANGVYTFSPNSQTDGGARPGPVAGTIHIAVGASGFESLGDIFSADFLDGPTPFTERRDFDLRPNPGAYHNLALGFSLRLPSGWKAFPGGGDQDAFFSTEGKAFLTGCGVASDRLPKAMAPREWFELWRYGSPATDRKIQQREMTSGGQTWKRVTYVHGVDPIDIAFLTQRNGIVWALYCTVDPPDLREAMADILAIVRSFRFDR
jgi:hypothetical protein